MNRIDHQALAGKGVYLPASCNKFFHENGCGLAMDAQPAMVTSPNGGIPGYLLNYLDPNIIKVIFSPMKAAEIVGEAQKGNWTTKTAQFPMVENTGEVSSYGDFSTSGRSDANLNWPSRQSYHYQTNTEWGEQQLAEAGEAKIDWAAQVNAASILTLNKFQNKTYFFGVSGLQNYGLINDPNLNPAQALDVDWTADATTGEQVVQSISKLFAATQAQLGGNLEKTDKMTLVMSPNVDAMAMTKVNMYNVNVTDLMKKNFPNMEVKTAVEYSTTAGELVQLIVDSVDGQKVAKTAFTEKLRAHPIIVRESSWRQKKSQGTWGTIIWLPAGIASKYVS